MKLSEKAMLATLSIKVWQARKLDKAATEETTRRAGASPDCARVIKDLLDKAESGLKAVQDIATAARTYHYEVTVPWNNDGTRLLPSVRFMEFREKMKSFEVDFNKAKEAFLAGYTEAAIRAEGTLQGLYDPEDYPPVNVVERKFEFQCFVNPVPDGRDFRVSLGNAEIEELSRDVEERTQKALAGTVDDLRQRVATYAGRMAYRLTDKEKDTPQGFHASLVENLVGLVDALPTLNLSDNAEINKACEQIKADLTRHTAEELKLDGYLRKQVATKAKTVLETVGYPTDYNPDEKTIANTKPKPRKPKATPTDTKKVEAVANALDFWGAE